ncbi:hypothetical protein J6590_009320 [Homalodisca vitripennis]|nr:hypothetical protein J6590_009320 [Homalodisca vitripennis]
MERFKPFIGMAKTMSNVTAPEIEGDNTNHDEFVDEPDELVDDGGDNQEIPARREMSIQGEPINMNLVRNYPTASPSEPPAKRRKPKSPGSNVDKIQEENLSRPGSSSTGSWDDSGLNYLTETVLEDQRLRLYDRFANL